LIYFLQVPKALNLICSEQIATQHRSQMRILHHLQNLKKKIRTRHQILHVESSRPHNASPPPPDPPDSVMDDDEEEESPATFPLDLSSMKEGEIFKLLRSKNNLINEESSTPQSNSPPDFDYASSSSHHEDDKYMKEKKI